MNKQLNSQKGFTLIELMIVIAIIGILAAIAIPQFAAYRAKSYNSAAQSDFRNVLNRAGSLLRGLSEISFRPIGGLSAERITIRRKIS